MVRGLLGMVFIFGVLGPGCSGGVAPAARLAAPDASTEPDGSGPSSLDAGSIDGGGTLLSDAGASADAGTPASDAGVADAGATDAGTVVAPTDGGAVDAGTPDAGSADAGAAPPDCSADAGFDARCLDAGTASLTITPTGAAQCAGLLPVSPPAPVNFSLTIGQPGGGITTCGQLPDGDGDLAVCSTSDPGTPADSRRTAILGAGGAQTLATLGGGPLLSQPHGIVAESVAVDYGQRSVLSGWGSGDGGTLVIGQIFPDSNGIECAVANGPDSDLTIGCQPPDAGPTLQQLDFAVRANGPAQALAAPILPIGIDEQNKMLAGDNAGGVRWYSRSGEVLSGAVNPAIHAPRALVGGGFDTELGELTSGGTTLTVQPDWLYQRPDALTLVRGRQAYAYVQPTTTCTQTVELLASDGTLCATIAVTEPNCVGTPKLVLGAEGTLSDEASRYSSADGQYSAIAWRVWPHLLQ